MVSKRLWWTLRMLMFRNAEKRNEYARNAGVYAGIGKNVVIRPRLVPLYSELIRFHNNVRVARGVEFVTHDTISFMLNRMQKETKSFLGEEDSFRFKERIGCIEILDNVFIGNSAIILYGTRIGPNVIVAAGSLVNKDCEPNSVYAGIPARRIGSFDDFARRLKENELEGEIAVTTQNQKLSDEEIKNAWNMFWRQHGQ